MSDSLVLHDTWITRLLRAVGLVTPTTEADFKAGADYASDYPANRSYSAATSMSAFAAFPWVFACADAIASDLSMLEINVTKDGETIDDHPVLALLREPSSRVDGLLFRRQLVIDLILTGDSYSLIIGEDEPSALLRMHPARTKIVPMPDGQPGRYEYSGSGSDSVYDWSRVVHVRAPSWEDSPASLYGQGAIRALNEDLQTDQAAAKLAANSAKTGRPSAIISPSEDGDRWSMEQIRVLREAYERQLSGTSGALFLGGPASYESLGWSPRDMEYQAVREYARQATLAAFSVPPTRVGLPTANYATAKQQARVYWESLRGRAAAIDAELTRLARLFPDSDRVQVSHSFADVEALQESRTERLNRVQAWYMMGISLEDAARYEGFADLPVGGDVTPASDETASTTTQQGIFDLLSRSPSVASDPALLPSYDAAAAKQLRDDVPEVWQIGSYSDEGDALIAMVERDGGLVARTPAEVALLRRRDEFANTEARGGSLRVMVNAAQMLTAPAIGLEYQIETLAKATEKAQQNRRAVAVGAESSAPVPVTITAGERGDIYWRLWLRDMHTPTERSFRLAVRRYSVGALERQQRRYAEMFTDARAVQRSLTDVQADKLLSQAEESALLDEALRAVYQEAVRRAYTAAADRVGLTGDSSVIQASIVRQRVDQLLQEWNETTKKDVLDIVEKAVEEGQTVAEVQAALESGYSYSPTRALRVARTETTRSLNTATRAAFDNAALDGVAVKMRWVSARDPVVREEHKSLDPYYNPNQADTDPGERFVTPDGNWSAEHPGGFGSPGMDINCRCTIVEIFED